MVDSNSNSAATVVSLPPPSAAPPTPISTPTASSTATPTTTTTTYTPGTKKMEHQLTKLKDANGKYKNLLKMAKERIQDQDDELELLKSQLKEAQEEIQNLKSTSSKYSNGYSSSIDPSNSNHPSIYHSYNYNLPSSTISSSSNNSSNTNSMEGGDDACVIVVRVHQRIKIETEDYNHLMSNEEENEESEGINSSEHSSAFTLDEKKENVPSPNSSSNPAVTDENEPHIFGVWALIEYEDYDPEAEANPTTNSINDSTTTTNINRFIRWRKFNTEQDLIDHIRRDTGEPITLPPYSLNARQSYTLETEAKLAVAHISEEFRRFRVKAEVARKQADSTMRSLQNVNVESAKRKIEGEDIASALAQAQTDHEQLAILRVEMQEQETHWKEAYDTLLAENNALKSSGSEALLAAQWRHRYESCLREKEDMESNLKMERDKLYSIDQHHKKADAGRYEAKYKDLKESFRLYRKKAKEIFEAQQRGEVSMLDNLGGDRGMDEARLSYLRNLMVNYLSSDPAVREHMEGAIGTVLKFTSEDSARITKKKEEHDSTWMKF